MSQASVYIRLVNTGNGAWLRAPKLERLLAQASAPVISTDWRQDAFRVIAGATAIPAVAAVALWAALHNATADGARWVCVATPVHLVAGMTNVTLSARGILNLSNVECADLAADFNRVFGNSGVRLWVAGGAVLLCVFDRVLRVGTRDPLEVVGCDVYGSQPTGDDAAQLRRLMSEMELWLYDHAVNRARTARDAAVITGLWLWGGGEPLSAAPGVHGWTAGSDPLFAAFGDAPQFPGAAAQRAGVLVCDVVPGAADWHAVEQRWLEPLAAALRAGRIQRLTLSVAARAVSVERGMRWRFWRRSRPWWQIFELQSSD